MSASCPYGASECPKIAELETRLDRSEDKIGSIYNMCIALLTGVVVEVAAICLTVIF